MKYSLFAGIDISKNDFEIALLNEKGVLIKSKKFLNKKEGFKKMHSWISKTGDIEETLFCLEHSGVYTLPICVFFEEYDLHYSLQAGLQIKRSMGIQRGKSDKADARMIGKYVYLNRDEIKCSKLPSSSILKMKSILSYRERLVKYKVALTTAGKELKSFSDQDIHLIVLEDSSLHLEQINQSICRIDKKLMEIIKEDEELNKLFGLITSVKGIGLQIAAHLLVVTHGFTRFETWRKFSCYTGTAPFEYSSGTSIRGKTRVSFLGNKKMKALLGNGIASAIQHDPEIAAYYKRKINEGKHKMLVMNSIKNKLISRVFAVVKRQTPYVVLKHTA